MTADLSRLMLRAYNAEADNCVRALRAGALPAATKRLETAANSIARLGKMMEMRVAPEYQALRITELELTADYLFKQQEEREVAREERERLREERKAEAELAAQREKLDKEREHYLNALTSAACTGRDGPGRRAGEPVGRDRRCDHQMPARVEVCLARGYLSAGLS